MKQNKKYNVYDYVDLGLPSCTLWANRNVGAKNDTDFGLYFACGETKGYTKTNVTKGVKSFNWLDYQFGNIKNISKYNKVDSLTVLLPEDDAASVNMGDEWCIPTVEQLEELITYTKREWLNNNGVTGIKFSSNKNDNYIFIPCSGEITDGSIYFENSKGFILSSNFNNNNETGVYCLRLSQNGCDILDNHGRCIGVSVRGVINNVK